MKISIMPIIRKDRVNKENSAPIQIRVTQNRKSRFIGTGVTIPIDDWDSEKQLIKSNSPKSKELQLQIDKRISELNRRIKKFEVLEIEVTLDNLLETNGRKINSTLGEYRVLTLDDFSPESYIAAIDICEQAGAEVIIIDSISHCWDYLLDFHANLQGNSFANWAKVTPRQNNFIRRILSSSSHVIKGRIPEAIHKPASQLLESDKTIYYERMAFCVEIPTIYEDVAGNRLNLSIGGVRAYNHENLYARKGAERFKIFIGFKNLVCCNMCVSSDGLVDDLRVMSVQQIYDAAVQLFCRYEMTKHLSAMARLSDYTLSEHQFAQLIGKTRLYQFLPSNERRQLPAMEFTDSHINAIARAYYADENFACNEDRSIDLWRVYNLFTGANKSSYIDTFLTRARNATDLTNGISRALNGDEQYNWFVE